MTFDANLQDLVDNPAETPSQELKEWQDVLDKVVRANLARHIAALSNFGGGFILVGFDKKGQEIPPGSVDPQSYSHDAINGIVEKYLVPPIHCDVTIVPSTKTSIPHPVIRVPGHHATPICTRAGGPQNAKGKPQGILQATYYLRMPGPKSEPITSPNSWKELIRRCIVREREELLRDISTVMQGTAISKCETPDFGLAWHEQCHERFQEVLEHARNFEWPVDYRTNHYQFSYRLDRGSETEIAPGDLVRVLEQANREVSDLVWTGWSMFYPFSPEHLRPYLVPEKVENKEVDVLESDLVDRELGATTLPDFWRFCGLGYASLIRPYREDRNVIENCEPPLRPGEWLSPFSLVREISEFIRHALIISRSLEGVENVEFHGRWIGLSNRRFAEFEARTVWDRRVAKANSRTVRGIWPMVKLAAEWESIVAEIANPVLRLFDGFEITTDWVRRASKRFRG